jgi:hypothetical protein
MAYCRSNGIALLVNRRKGQVWRVRGSFGAGLDKDFNKLEDLFKFILTCQ